MYPKALLRRKEAAAMLAAPRMMLRYPRDEHVGEAVGPPRIQRSLSAEIEVQEGRCHGGSTGTHGNI